MNRILLVEDEKSIREALRLNLELEDYEVITAHDGEEAMTKLKSQHFDLLLLDLMLPKISGLEICQMIRLTNPTLPIIMLTAKDAAQDIIKGLKSGADDYITKPFQIEELLLRIKNIFRRTQTQKNQKDLDTIHFGSNSVNFKNHKAIGVHGEFQLTKKEAHLLKLFFTHKDEVISRNTILKTVWGYDVFPSTRTVDNFIMAFRKYFEQNPRSPRHFHSVRGVGYKFTE